MPMLTLFAIPFACSLATEIVLAEHGLPYTVRWVSRFGARLVDGGDFKAINPKGKVPVLLRDGGAPLTENVAVLLAAQRLGEVPFDDLRLIEMLSFVSAEVHRAILRPCFDPTVPEATKTYARSTLLPVALSHLDAQLAGHSYLGGASPLAADAYVFWACLLLRFLGVELTRYPALQAFVGRMHTRPYMPDLLKAQAEARAAHGA